MRTLKVEIICFEDNRIDYTFELIMIMAFLNHDSCLALLDSRYVDCLYDGSRGYLELDFISACTASRAESVLKNRGYHVKWA